MLHTGDGLGGGTIGSLGLVLFREWRMKVSGEEAQAEWGEGARLPPVAPLPLVLMMELVVARIGEARPGGESMPPVLEELPAGPVAVWWKGSI